MWKKPIFRCFGLAITFFTYPTYYSSFWGAHKPVTRAFQCYLSWDQCCTCPSVQPLSISFSVDCLHVPFDLPLFLLPGGVHPIATLGTESGYILKTCPNHLYFFFCIALDKGTVLVLSWSFLFEYVQDLSKTWHLEDIQLVNDGVCGLPCICPIK